MKNQSLVNMLNFIQKNKFFVTYNLRFHPILSYLKPKLMRNKIFYLEAETSSYLPCWRKILIIEIYLLGCY